MGIVCRYHKGFLYAAVEVFQRTALFANDTLKHLAKEGTARALFGLATGLFIVKYCQYTCYLGCILVCIQQCHKSGMYHAQVVQTSRANELIVYAYGACWGGVIQIQIEINDVCCRYL